MAEPKNLSSFGLILSESELLALRRSLPCAYEQKPSALLVLCSNLFIGLRNRLLVMQVL